MVKTARWGRRIGAAVAASVTLALSGLTLGAQPAHAIGTNLRPGIIYWNANPCDDGPYVDVHAAWRVSGAPAGYNYQTRLGAYTNQSGRLGLGPLEQRYASAPFNPAGWSDTFSSREQSEITAFVWQWNGSEYVLYARETVQC